MITKMIFNILAILFLIEPCYADDVSKYKLPDLDNYKRISVDDFVNQMPELNLEIKKHLLGKKEECMNAESLKEEDLINLYALKI